MLTLFTVAVSHCHNTHTLFLAMNYEHFGREGVQIAQFELKFVISLLVVEQ